MSNKSQKPIQGPVDSTINIDLLKKFVKAFPKNWKEKIREDFRIRAENVIEMTEKR